MNQSRAAYVSRFVLVLLAIVLICALTVCGVYINKDTQLNGIVHDGTIRLGLDLAGGSVVTYRAQTTDTGDALSTGMESVLSVMRTRLDGQGLTEALAYLVGDDMISIEIPDVDDPNEVIDGIMKTARLTFRSSEGTSNDNNVMLEGKDVESAYVGVSSTDSSSSGYVVQLKFNASGEKKFAEATKQAAKSGTPLYIYMDDTLLSYPKVDSKFSSEGITGGQAVIEGNFDQESATVLANNINAGALKYTLSVEEQRTVGATLGQNSLSRALIAGAIGLALVIIFMCVYYRLCGVMASIALCAYTGIFGLVLIATQANLTLAGIAGIVLSVGMAVDANVVIFERIKEEIDSGKSAKAAVKSGFSRAFAAILDSNVTTVIACVVLYFLGSGTIKGFATTLFIGVVLSLFTALVVTRLLLNLCLGMGISDTRKYRSIGRRAQND